jgi:hypothetical protein
LNERFGQVFKVEERALGELKEGEIFIRVEHLYAPPLPHLDLSCEKGTPPDTDVVSLWQV